jgi:hypothetical protein
MLSALGDLVAASGTADRRHALDRRGRERFRIRAGRFKGIRAARGDAANNHVLEMSPLAGEGSSLLGQFGGPVFVRGEGLTGVGEEPFDGADEGLAGSDALCDGRFDLGEGLEQRANLGSADGQSGGRA